MSHRQATDAALAEIARSLEAQLRRHKRDVRASRQQMRLIRSRLASVRAECNRRGVELHDAR
ncbi:hypothetical protein [Sphingomonas sp. VNH70]|uniref:hypothetical protein n=1 Tax=Sphingomonas silueang TaxID=3156617 RepID=UPI0032B53CBC